MIRFMASRSDDWISVLDTFEKSNCVVVACELGDVGGELMTIRCVSELIIWSSARPPPPLRKSSADPANELPAVVVAAFGLDLLRLLNNLSNLSKKRLPPDDALGELGDVDVILLCLC
jgi:hypothetical protein